MGLLIDPHQSAFIEGRQITDGIIILNEMVDEAKNSKKSILIFKADFEKAYDSVNWNFLNSMMSKLGLCPKWRNWIQECISSATVSVLVNGSPTEEFIMEKGLRQGDPLALFLFLMIAEALNGLILKAVEDNLFRGVEVGKSLKVNFFKSSLIGLTMETDELDKFAEKLNCVTGQTPFKYLGVLIGTNPKRTSLWTPVVETMRKRLSNWKRDSLSFGGRIILLKSVLLNIPVYCFSTHKAPKQVILLLTKIQRNFLWGGREGNRKIAWVKWDNICKSKLEGGIGVKELSKFNLALLGKWRWRLLVEKEALWKQVLEAKYRMDRRIAWEGGKWRGSVSKWWKELWELDGAIGGREGWFKEGVVKKVGEGKDTLFWHEIWAGDKPLKEKYSRLFSLSRDKDAVITDMGSWNNKEWMWNWRWRRCLFAWETNLLQELLSLLQRIQLTEGEDDKWVWKYDPKSSYTVRSA
ncbi:hypothetical protein SLEP1_g26913 [Rubroshorea leprosula]|uniref:Reverse transcriptase domain-containing protein n=1 Tax=Rubroshorea leprosula TaxID=152421 RepID=A0AAV5JXZ2_9ROSI|nr:hypothetical protein SLEP1_g26913 [Rubroshorea leprosula]